MQVQWGRAWMCWDPSDLRPHRRCADDLAQKGPFKTWRINCHARRRMYAAGCPQGDPTCSSAQDSDHRDDIENMSTISVPTGATRNMSLGMAVSPPRLEKLAVPLCRDTAASGHSWSPLDGGAPIVPSSKPEQHARPESLPQGRQSADRRRLRMSEPPRFSLAGGCAGLMTLSRKACARGACRGVDAGLVLYDLGSSVLGRSPSSFCAPSAAGQKQWRCCRLAPSGVPECLARSAPARGAYHLAWNGDFAAELARFAGRCVQRPLESNPTQVPDLAGRSVSTEAIAAK